MPDPKPTLIPIADARGCTWPTPSGQRRMRILGATPTPKQREWLAARDGDWTLVDTTGAGDAFAWYSAIGRIHGWADRHEVMREIGKLDCPLGQAMRDLRRQLREEDAA